MEGGAGRRVAGGGLGGDSQGDSQGTRWGFPGDSRSFWGTRSEKRSIFLGFQGDSPETTLGFYKIKKGVVRCWVWHAERCRAPRLASI